MYTQKHKPITTRRLSLSLSLFCRFMLKTSTTGAPVHTDILKSRLHKIASFLHSARILYGFFFISFTVSVVNRNLPNIL